MKKKAKPVACKHCAKLIRELADAKKLVDEFMEEAESLRDEKTRMEGMLLKRAETESEHGKAIAEQLRDCAAENQRLAQELEALNGGRGGSGPDAMELVETLREVCVLQARALLRAQGGDEL